MRLPSVLMRVTMTSRYSFSNLLLMLSFIESKRLLTLSFIESKRLWISLMSPLSSIISLWIISNSRKTKGNGSALNSTCGLYSVVSGMNLFYQGIRPLSTAIIIATIASRCKSLYGGVR